MFNKENPEPVNNTERNILAKNTKFKGDIVSDGDFRIDGTLDGKLRTKGRVIIGASGTIKGKLEAANADVEGKFNGNMTLTGTLTIKATANINGEVVTNKLSVEPGSVFNGNCSMGASVKELNKDEQQKKQTQSA